MKINKMLLTAILCNVIQTNTLLTKDVKCFWKYFYIYFKYSLFIWKANCYYCQWQKEPM